MPLRLALLLILAVPFSAFGQLENASLEWKELPPLPNELGVAGPLVGVHHDALIVAGGANFAPPIWETQKQWHDEIYVLTKSDDGYRWRNAGRLPKRIGYAATVSTPEGVLCMGGNDSTTTFSDVFALRWENGAVTVVEYPPLPSPCVYGDAAFLDGAVYLAGGQSTNAAGSEMNNFWKLELTGKPGKEKWKTLPAWDGPPRVHNITVAQSNGFHDAIYVISGRWKDKAEFGLSKFLLDMWEFTPETQSWRKRAQLPQCVMAGTGIAYGQSNLFVLGGDNGDFVGDELEELKDAHPGFPKVGFVYNTITDSWAETGPTPSNHVTTKAVMFDDKIVIPSGEVRPRKRSPKVWSVEPMSTKHGFGAVNYAVLFGYLAAMSLVGVYFAQKNKTTDDYFRGGKQIPWWAAGCSIYATMLSSLTYTGIPSKAFAQNWVLAVNNFMIPVVAIVAVRIALPFYRRIDATSAYEYLERRFNRPVRLFGSACFTLYHLFRMAVVMSLTGLALSVATPLTPTQSVLMIGLLSLAYCTMGGIEAVIWTDTIQTVVLLGGAVLAILFLVGGIDGGWLGFIQTGASAGKFEMANWNFDPTSAQVAIWFIILGSIAQNVSSYTSDQAVVQRYMTTETQSLAARSIWTNAVLSIPTTFLFFAIGSALYAYYRTHPEKLDPTIASDQVFPLFIARELPVGLAGLIVAGIFAAAQSTVSTSMNSTATTIVTDFLRPRNFAKTEKSYLRIAQALTLLFGMAGTALGLLFVDPNIKSLFDTFIGVIGLFMGVLGGLFVLGALTQKANGAGAFIGAIGGAAITFFVWRFTEITVYLYTFCGIASCFVIGYTTSLLLPREAKDLAGLTIYTLDSTTDEGLIDVA